jgi:hypothetical protein
MGGSGEEIDTIEYSLSLPIINFYASPGTSPVNPAGNRHATRVAASDLSLGSADANDVYLLSPLRDQIQRPPLGVYPCPPYSIQAWIPKRRETPVAWHESCTKPLTPSLVVPGTACLRFEVLTAPKNPLFYSLSFNTFRHSSKMSAKCELRAGRYDG